MVGIVFGDVTAEEVIKAVAESFGAIRKRKPGKIYPGGDGSAGPVATGAW